MRSQRNWQESLSKLIEGNKRFRLGLRSVESFASSMHLRELAEKGQNPSAIILTCSDSRVPAEIVFDKGFGDLFVIRIAGNVVSKSAIASIEYAAIVLKTPLCVVMGHTLCGAVGAAVSHVVDRVSAPTEYIEILLKKITPAVQEAIEAKAEGEEKTLLQQSVLANVRYQVRRLKEGSPALNQLVSKEKFSIVGAVYDLKNGEVEFDRTDISNYEAENKFSKSALNDMSLLAKDHWRL